VLVGGATDVALWITKKLQTLPKIPCSSDVPADFRVALFDGTNRENTIYHSKAVGEPPLMLGISVFAAIADALHSLAPRKSVPLDAPATPESILRAVQELVGTS
jgi:xanthine dehydrogenase large subunit